MNKFYQIQCSLGQASKKKIRKWEREISKYHPISISYDYTEHEIMGSLLLGEDYINNFHKVYPKDIFGNYFFKILSDRDWRYTWNENLSLIMLGHKICFLPYFVDAPEKNVQSIAQCNELFLKKAVETDLTENNRTQKKRMNNALSLVPLWLDSRDAFGDGTHPTTQLCLRLLFALLQTKLPSSELTTLQVLDIGSGSGILSLLAAAKGIKNLTLIDIEPAAIDRCRENIELNFLKLNSSRELTGTEHYTGHSTEISPSQTTKPTAMSDIHTITLLNQKWSLHCMDIASFSDEVKKKGLPLNEEEGQTFPLILANLQSAILIENLLDIYQLLSPGGYAILSGVWYGWHENFLTYIRQHSWNLLKIRQRQSWMAYLLHK